MKERLLQILGSRTDLYPSALERDFPRLLDNLMALWDSPDFETYADELLLNARSGRQGFPPEVGLELFHLVEIHRIRNEQRNPKPKDAWDEIPEDNHRGTWDGWDE